MTLNIFGICELYYHNKFFVSLHGDISGLTDRKHCSNKSTWCFTNKAIKKLPYFNFQVILTCCLVTRTSWFIWTRLYYVDQGPLIIYTEIPGWVKFKNLAFYLCNACDGISSEIHACHDTCSHRVLVPGGYNFVHEFWPQNHTWLNKNSTCPKVTIRHALKNSKLMMSCRILPTPGPTWLFVRS